MDLYSNIHIITAPDVDALAEKMVGVQQDFANDGATVVQVSHAVDPTAPAEKRYSAVLLGTNFTHPHA